LLPKYQKANRQKPLDEEELDRLRVQFQQRMLNIPGDKETVLKDSKEEYGIGAKALATTEGAGAGVLGGVKTMAELCSKIQKYLGTIGKPAKYVSDQVAKYASKQEGKAYEDASLVSPKGASRGAAIGHQIPAAIATAGVGGALPTAAKGAGLATKVAIGAGRGIAEGATFEASRPGGDPKSGVIWGGMLGAAFPLLGKMFGLGRKSVSAGAPEAAKAVGTATAEGTTAKAASSMGDIADIAAKKKFGKSFKDLTSAEKAQMPAAMKEEIKAQQAVKQATAKAEKAGAKAAKEAEGAAQRAEKAKAASAKATQQAQKRAAVPATTPVQKEAVATKAAEENPSIGKVLGSVEKRVVEGKSPTGVERRGLKDIKGPDPIREARIKELEGLAKTGTTEEKAYAESALKDMKEHPFESGDTLGEDIRKARAKQGSTPITKVPEGQEGKKVRAEGGKPASPAQQASDRERIAKKRELAKKEEFGSALEKHAQELAGKHTAGSVGIMHIPELEDAMKEFPNGELFLKGFQKLRKAGRITDELYMHEMKDWLLTQFEGHQ
jgi:hypothetical protein